MCQFQSLQKALELLKDTQGVFNDISVENRLLIYSLQPKLNTS